MNDFEYLASDDLSTEDALEDLKGRAKQQDISLADLIAAIALRAQCRSLELQTAKLQQQVVAAAPGWYAIYFNTNGYVDHYPVAFWKTSPNGLTVGHSTVEPMLTQADSEHLDAGWKGYCYKPNGIDCITVWNQAVYDTYSEGRKQAGWE